MASIMLLPYLVIFNCLTAQLFILIGQRSGVRRFVLVRQTKRVIFR